VEEMKERGIIFSAPMVRAILDGRKSQTRRPIKPQPRVVWGNMDMGGPIHFSSFPAGVPVAAYDDAERTVKVLTCPHGAPGDRLWVRETAIISPAHWCDRHGSTHPDAPCGPRCVQYLASYPCRDTAIAYKLKATPSIFMPRWASRITLEIVSVRVERVQDITEADAKAEGVHAESVSTVPGIYGYVAPFVEIWDSIYTGAHGWEANPWVWAIAFRRVEGGK
jgi:hypothetical protein